LSSAASGRAWQNVPRRLQAEKIGKDRVGGPLRHRVARRAGVRGWIGGALRRGYAQLFVAGRVQFPFAALPGAGTARLPTLACRSTILPCVLEVMNAQDDF